MTKSLLKRYKTTVLLGLLTLFISVFGLMITSQVAYMQKAYAATPPPPKADTGDIFKDTTVVREEGPGLGKNVKNEASTKGKTCGNSTDDKENVHTKFNFDCLGPDYKGGTLSPIMDVTYAIIRFLSAGVGVVVIISIILAGIKYSSSEGNAEATQAAKDRVKATLIGLLVYIFAFAIVQYLVPGGVFN